MPFAWTEKYASALAPGGGAGVAASASGDDLVIARASAWEQTITGLGSIAGRQKLWFTVKRSHGHSDAQAIIQIEETDGLLYLEGAAAGDAAWGSITVDDEDAGDVALRLSAEATELLTKPGTAAYDLKWLDAAGDPHRLAEASVEITKAVTHAIA